MFDDSKRATGIARNPPGMSANVEAGAVDHFLEFGEDPARTVALAEANHTLRPNAEAKEALALAYLGAGRAADARRVIEEALATPFVSASLHMAASEVYGALADTERADQQRALAVTINPHAAD